MGRAASRSSAWLRAGGHRAILGSTVRERPPRPRGRGLAAAGLLLAAEQAAEDVADRAALAAAEHAAEDAAERVVPAATASAGAAEDAAQDVAEAAAAAAAPGLLGRRRSRPLVSCLPM